MRRCSQGGLPLRRGLGRCCIRHSVSAVARAFHKPATLSGMCGCCTGYRGPGGHACCTADTQGQMRCRQTRTRSAENVVNIESLLLTHTKSHVCTYPVRVSAMEVFLVALKQSACVWHLPSLSSIKPTCALVSALTVGRFRRHEKVLGSHAVDRIHVEAFGRLQCGTFSAQMHDADYSTAWLFLPPTG